MTKNTLALSIVFRWCRYSKLTLIEDKDLSIICIDLVLCLLMAWSPAGAMTADIVLQEYSHFRNSLFLNTMKSMRSWKHLNTILNDIPIISAIFIINREDKMYTKSGNLKPVLRTIEISYFLSSHQFVYSLNIIMTMTFHMISMVYYNININPFYYTRVMAIL